VDRFEELQSILFLIARNGDQWKITCVGHDMIYNSKVAIHGRNKVSLILQVKD
jgi:hypothetical protein